MKGKCIICGEKTSDADEGNVFEDVYIAINGKIKWVCRNCMSVLNVKLIHGNNLKYLEQDIKKEGEMDEEGMPD